MTSNAGAPLLEGQNDELEDENRLDDHHERAPENHTRHTGRLGFFVWLLTLSAGISGLLFGYDTGVISATLVSIGTSLSNRELTSLDKSIITSSTSLFALIASPLSSVLADQIGRKPIIIAADALFVSGALVQALSTSVCIMVLGRSIVGLAIGAASFVTPLYLAELAPTAHRGTVVTMNALAITFGQVVAYIVGWLFAEYGGVTTGWRIMVGIGAAPAILQCVLLFIMPETPRWLVKANRSDEARAVIQQTCGSNPINLQMVNDVLRHIELEVREEEESAGLRTGDGKASSSFLVGWRELVLVPKNRRALTIACMLQGFQQLCGFNSLMYFSATIFLMLGFTVPTLTSLSVASTNFIFTIVALLLIDKIGRRRILLYSVPFMAFGLLGTAIGFGMPGVSTIEAHGPALTKTTAIFILANIILYVASYAIGLGNVPWMQSELFSLNVRSMGSGLATATNWGANFIVGLTFLPLMDALGACWTFSLYSIVCIAGWVAIWWIYPETVGISLEDVSGLLEHGWGVR